MRSMLAGIAVVLAVAACRESVDPAGPSGAELDVAAAPAQTAPEKYIVLYKSTVGDPRAEITRNVSVMGTSPRRPRSRRRAPARSLPRAPS